MHYRSIFREFKLPVARSKGRLPVFLDFTIGCTLDEASSLNMIAEWLSKGANTFDGIIVLPEILPSLSPLHDKEVWVRADKKNCFTPQRDAHIKAPLEAPHDLVHRGVSAILGTLELGNPPSSEADNVQHLAFLRSRSLDVGLPFIIDLHLVRACLEQEICAEMVELGLNLIVELGGDVAILPGDGYLVRSMHLSKIASIPVLARQSIQVVGSDRKPALEQSSFSNKIEGFVYTGLQESSFLLNDLRLFEEWSKSFEASSLGGI